MDRYVVLCMVGDIYQELISFSYINCRPWEHPINCDYWFCMAKSAHILHLYLKPIKKKQNKKQVFNFFFKCKKVDRTNYTAYRKLNRFRNLH